MFGRRETGRARRVLDRNGGTITMTRAAVRIFAALFTTVALFSACSQLANGGTPKIALYDVTSGKLQVNPGDTVDFGTVSPSGPTTSTHTFSVENTGTADLSLAASGNKIVIAGSNPSYFTIPTQPPQSIPAGGSISFDVVLTAVGTNQTKNATIGISSNDPALGDISYNATGYDGGGVL